MALLLGNNRSWYFRHTQPKRDTLYGADIAVHPDYRGRGIARLLYEERKRIMRRFNLRRMVAGGRIPGYRRLAGLMTPEDYIDQVIKGELKDPALSTQLKIGFQVKGVIMDYLNDAESLNYATYLEMLNPKYNPEKRKIAAPPIRRPVRRVRVCAAQYQMRRIKSWEEFEQQVEFFVTTADEYHCHILLFPELFTAELFSIMDPNLDTLDAVKQLSGYTERYIEMFRRLSRDYHIHIIGGSHPVAADSAMFNVAHLFTPSGNVYTQDKLHITPGERRQWGIHPGRGIKIFDTGLARIAIQVCYDIEFPELARILTLAGVEVIFVPFSTDERKSYNRVRYCAQARAVENWLYVVISGNVGNLPNIRSFLINSGQAAVFTPSDFAFPINAIAAEADSNSETVVITDLDLNSLAIQRDIGSVRPLQDRRPDIYELKSNIPIEIVRTS